MVACSTYLSFTALALSWVACATKIPNPPKVGDGTRVNLRIEGNDADGTIFEDVIATTGHDITTPSGGTHHCDGTNNGANPTPGPTCSSALDDASKQQKRFKYDGTFDTSFDDYFITSIRKSSETSTQFWGLLVDYQFTPVGGCQQEVTEGQEVLWAFDAFNKVHFLKVTGPDAIKKGKQAVYQVTDGSTGATVSGASLFGQTSDATGKVTVTFTSTGLKYGKATRADSLRSNAIYTTVV